MPPIRLLAKRRALAVLPLIAGTLLSAGMTGQAAAAPTPNYSLAVSTQADRSSAVALSGRTFVQPAAIRVFTTPTTSARRVRFYLDDATMSRTPYSIDASAPFDLAGTASDGSAIGLDTSRLSAAQHTVTAAVETTNGKTRVVSATFTVNAPPSTADTTKPTPGTLSSSPGDRQITLNWTAASDNVGVTRYEVWKDDAYVTTLPAATLSHVVGGLTNGVSHVFRVVAYDAAGNYANTNNVTEAAKTSTSTTSPGPGAAAFPSRLKTSGRSIVDENGYVLPTLRGFNMHVSPSFAWSQSHFDAIAALGGKINRAVIHWDHFEPSQGVISSSAIASLDAHIARAQAAGIYTLLELHLNVGRVPSWTSGRSTEMEKYAAYGQTLTQYLAYRYGNPASPQYTKAVVGFGLNEPPLEDSTIRNGNSSIPYLEGKQRQMISWMRAPGFAPSWIGFVAYGYASATPIYDDTKQNAGAADASPTAFDSVGGNVVIDVHDYSIGCTNTDPNCDGRQWNGMIWPTWQGGPMQTTQETPSYTSTSVRQSQHAAFMKPYKTFSTQANIPLMLGEWGWVDGHTGETAYINDKKAAWSDAGTVIQIDWNYDISASNSEWAARPGGTWRTSITNLFASGS